MKKLPLKINGRVVGYGEVEIDQNGEVNTINIVVTEEDVYLDLFPDYRHHPILGEN